MPPVPQGENPWATRQEQGFVFLAPMTKRHAKTSKPRASRRRSANAIVHKKRPARGGELAQGTGEDEAANSITLGRKRRGAS